MDKLVNIAAFILPIGLFVYFGILGTATLILLRSQRNLLQNLLLSPAVGLAFTLLPVFLLNRAGLPIKDVAIPFTICSFILSIAIILYRKPIIPVSRYIGFALVFFLALCLTGRPLLYFGFNWLSYGNDDMANYCLGALRFLNHGYFDIPHATSMLQGKDYSQYYWFTFVPGMVRSGSELLLAWFSGLTHSNPLQLFMPLILGFHLILISSIAGMVLVSKKYKRIALITSLFVACSALTTLATLYQLIAQVLGLSLLIATGALLQQLFSTTLKSNLFRQSILLSVLTSALLITYPEIVPILGLAFVIYLIVSLLRGWRLTKLFGLLLSLCVIESIFLLNTYWINIFTFLHFQITADLSHSKGDLFPYFLVPSGIADLWGLQPLAMIPREPISSMTILLGFFLSVVTLFFIVKQTAKRYFPAVLALAIVLLGLYLFMGTRQQSGFNLFKLAMYIQPFIFAVLAAGIVSQLTIKNRKKIIAIFVVTIMGLSIQFSYVLASYGNLGQPYSELPLASRTRLPTELSKLAKKTPSPTPVISEATSVVTAKLQSLFLLNEDTKFLSSNIFFFPYLGGKIFKITSPKSYQVAEHLQTTLSNNELKLPFIIRSLNGKPLVSYFYKQQSLFPTDATLLIDTPMRNIFNRIQMADVENINYLTVPLSNISNHLVFINSSLGQNYYLGESAHISLYGLEKDYFYAQSSVASIGRYLLFQILNPSQQYRFVLDFTETLNHTGQHQLPPAKIIGDKEYPLPLIGRGSARVFSSKFSSRMIKNTPYFMIDMGVEPKALVKPRSGLMLLYGRDIPLNHRLFVGHARDFSLISEEEYQQLTPPSYISHFPSDLSNSSLEYSGIYEDGWFSEDVFLKLAQSNSHTKLTIQGLLPTFRQHNNSIFLTVRIDNQQDIVKQINPGPFHFQLNIPAADIKRVVKLHFSEGFSLPKGDSRIVAVKIEAIGFKTGEIGRNYILPSYIKNFTHAFKNNKFEHSGIYEDGWFSKDAYLTMSQLPGQTKFVINGLLPKQKNNTPVQLEVYLDGVKTNESLIKPGAFNLAMMIPAADKIRSIQLKFNRYSLLSKRDNRPISIKVDNIGFIAG